MSLLYAAAGAGIGFVLGVGATLLYIRRQMKSSLGQIEEQIDAMDDMFDEMEGDQSS